MSCMRPSRRGGDEGQAQEELSLQACFQSLDVPASVGGNFFGECVLDVQG